MRDHPVFRRRRLPHWDIPGATYFVTPCLEGSIPATGLLELRKYRNELDERTRPQELTEEEWDQHKQKALFVRFDDLIDREPAVRYLEDERLAECVRNGICHFAGKRYDLLAYVIMPSHYHWVFRPTPEWSSWVTEQDDERTPRERIMHSIQGYTAGECNRLLGRKGTFWQVESYDHCVRDADEFARIAHYVEENPVRAGLAREATEWRFSSAHDRLKQGVPVGTPLLRPGG